MASDPDSVRWLADVMTQIAIVVAAVDGDLNDKEAAAGGNALRSLAFNSDSRLVRAAATLAAGDPRVFDSLKSRTPSDVLATARPFLEMLPRDHRLRVYRDLLWIGHVVADAHGGGFLNRDRISDRERQAIILSLEMVGATRPDILQAMALANT
jgi:hypothetical protein